VGFVKKVGFKPGVNERGVMNVQSGESKEVGEWIGESEIEELVGLPEWRWGRFQRQGEDNERSDQLFLERMMKVAEQE